MKKQFFLSLFLLIACSKISAQNSDFVQINGGIISPFSSSNGLTASLQYIYEINSTVSFYVYSGYANWDKHFVIYREDLSPVQKQQLFKTYSSNEHILVPLNIGSKINFNTNKIFTAFAILELGYSYLSYNSYAHFKSINPETGEVLGYYPNPSTKKEIQENIFGLGVGAGLSHPMTRNLNLILSFKLNSNISSNHSSFFSSRNTYTTFLTGINFGI